MKRIFFLAVLTAALSACAVEGEPIRMEIMDSPCGPSTKGKTPASIIYRTENTFELSTKLDWEVYENTEFRIELKPKPGSESALVQTIGVSGTLPGGASTPFNWLDGRGMASKLPDQTLVLCVPEVPAGTVYKFDIVVGGIGRLDPRIHVR
jgi:hypothetical protein